MRKFIPFLKKPPRVSIVRLSGVISASGSGSSGISDIGFAPLLERAFTRGKPQAVALQINSPGGSPVQSSLIGARIRRLSEENNVPVFAFVEDVAASGGYWLAAAADEILVDPSSVLGSIGVISSSFGAHEFIARHGVERRVYTAGTSKSMLDPFVPEKAEDVDRLKHMLEDIHGHFIDHVKNRRGAKLVTDQDLFTGEIWVGQRAIDVGLADGIGHLAPVMEERFGPKVKYTRYGQKRSVLRRFGLNAAQDAVFGIEERAQYARFGL